MAMDTSTVRLVIFLGMFLVFAGDYSNLVASIFGKSAEQNLTSEVSGPEGPPRHAIHEPVSLTSAAKEIDKENAVSRRARMMATIKTACLPKLICELTSSVHHDQLSEMERSLLNLISMTEPEMFRRFPRWQPGSETEEGIIIFRHRSWPDSAPFAVDIESKRRLALDTSLSTVAEVPSRYHFAAHMGQLIAGLEGQGCHNFYPTCPLPGSSVLNMMKKIRLR